MDGRTLAQLIRDRIDMAYAGNQAAFARAIGASVQSVNAWVKGKVALPQAETRRRLARELGVRHVELFVLAGELDPAEIGPPAPLPWPPDDPRVDIVDLMRPLTIPESEYLRFIVEGAIAMAHALEQPRPRTRHR